MTLPATVKQWNVTGITGFDALRLSEQPLPDHGPNDVLVRIKGAALNYRDIIIPIGKYPFSLKDNVVPGSDGAGTVLAVGKDVTRFAPGDDVVTIIQQHYLAGSTNAAAAASGLGGALDGTFRTIGVFNEQGLVKVPKGLTHIEASTLSCAGLSAWNALFGLPGKELRPGQWLLTQGTGGVSLFAVQFAKLIGARVIATTSSDKKADILRKLGADKIINYVEQPEWSIAAKTLTGGAGVDLVVDVAGATTLRQSFDSLATDGLLVTMGFVGGEGDASSIPNLLDCWIKGVTVRGIHVGNRQHMEEMCRAIEGNIDKLRPVVDPRVFTLEQLKEAYQYLQAGQHQGKVCIKID